MRTYIYVHNMYKMTNWFSIKTVVYVIATLFLVLQLRLALHKFLAKPSMVSPASRPFARQRGLMISLKQGLTAGFKI